MPEHTLKNVSVIHLFLRKDIIPLVKSQLIIGAPYDRMQMKKTNSFLRALFRLFERKECIIHLTESATCSSKDVTGLKFASFYCSKRSLFTCFISSNWIFSFLLISQWSVIKKREDYFICLTFNWLTLWALDHWNMNFSAFLLKERITWKNMTLSFKHVICLQNGKFKAHM